MKSTEYGKITFPSCSVNEGFACSALGILPRRRTRWTSWPTLRRLYPRL